MSPSPVATTPPIGPSTRALVESAYTESAVRRSENVFFISLPFTALYAALLTGGAALAIERGNVRNPDLYLGISVGLATTASALITWRDHRAPRPAPVLPPASTPAESGTILIDSPR